jgi:YVTN family beta-propeller protein
VIGRFGDRVIWHAALLAVSSLAGAQPGLIVLHKGASSLGFYTASGEHVSDVAVGTHPHEIALSADGRYAYITDNGTMRIEQAGTGGNTVSVVDLLERKKVAAISLGEFRRPHGIDLDHKTGLLAVSTELPDRVIVIDTKDRRILRTLETRGKTSHMVKWGPDSRRVFVSNSNSADVSVVDTQTGDVKLIPTAKRPEGSALSPDGRLLYVVNREAARLTLIDTARQAAVGEIRTGKGPVRIAVTPDGRQLVYALMHDKKIGFADPARRKVLGQVALGGAPVSLTLSVDGKLAYASAQDDDTVYVVSVAERRVVSKFKTAPGAGPDPVLDIGTVQITR